MIIIAGFLSGTRDFDFKLACEIASFANWTYKASATGNKIGKSKSEDVVDLDE